MAVVNAPVPIWQGGTGATDAATARSNLGLSAAGDLFVGPGLTGGGSLASSVTIYISGASNGYGFRYVSTTTPSGGSDGDIWYQI